MHPEDRDKTVNMCVSLSDQGTDHEADYRALTATGDYVWIRDVVHVIRENNETVAIIGFMFDISARKQMELELEALSRKNLALSLQDPLTLVANRKALREHIEKTNLNVLCVINMHCLSCLSTSTISSLITTIMDIYRVIIV